MPDRIVRIILSGDSRGAVRAIEETQGAVERFSSRTRRVGSSIKGAGAAFSYVSAGVAAIGYESVKSAMSYQKAMTLIRAQTNASAGEISFLNRNLMRINGRFGFNPTQMANGLYALESAGLRGHAAIKALIAAMKGAQIGGDTLESTTDAVAGAMRTGAKDTRSAAATMQILDTIVGQGKMHLEDLTASLKSGILQQAVSLHLGLRDVGSALAAMTRQGIPAEQEASRMRLILTKMSAASGLAAKQMSALKIGHYELANDMRKPNGLIRALSDLQDHLRVLTPNQQNQALANMFGQSRGLATIRGLLNALPQMERIQGVVNKAGVQTFSAHWAETQRTAAFQVHKAWAQIQTAAVQLGQAILPVLIPILHDLTREITRLAHWFEHLSGHTKRMIVMAGLFVAALGPALVIVGSLVIAVSALMDPVTAVIIGVAAAGAAFMILYKRCAGFRNTVNTLYRFIKVILGDLWAYYKATFADFYQIIKGFMQFAKGIWEVINGIWTLNLHQIWRGLKNIFGGGVKMIVGEFKFMTQPIRSVFDDVRKYWNKILNGMLSAVKWFAKQAFKVLKSVTGVSGHGLMSWVTPWGELGHAGKALGIHLPFARGGLVPHPGSGGSAGQGGDTVAAMLTPGEFVLRPQVVSAIGVQNLNSLNQSGQLASGTPGEIVIPVTLKVGERVLAQAVTRYSGQMAARK